MREEIFAALAPVCPRCLHQSGTHAPVVVATREATRADHLWHGVLHCSNQACWMEFPVVDGVPILVPDPVSVLKNQQQHLLWRTDLPPVVSSVLGDAYGPGDAYDTLRYHLSLYGGDHYAGWGAPGASGVKGLIDWGMDRLEETGKLAGPCLDLGGSVGRGGWELGHRAGGPALVADLNLSMLRFGQQLALEGTARLGLRRVGIVYDEVSVIVPDEMAGATPDFWAVDAAMLPFGADLFGTLTGINLVDCTSTPTAVLSEIGRVLRAGGGALIATPHDWSPQATELSHWLGGHSQRGPHGGAPEPVLATALIQIGMENVVEDMDLMWRLRLHARSTMEYRVHALAGRKADGPFSAGLSPGT